MKRSDMIKKTFGNNTEQYALYEELTSPDWAQCLIHIPNHMWGGVMRWVLFGIKPGDFLQAVIRNDLFEAAGRADDMNRHSLWNYCNFFHNASPSLCFGSEDVLEAWKGMYPEEKDEAA